MDNAGNVKEKYVPLVGGVLLTLRPNETIEAQKATYSLSNIHGDIFVTTDKSGSFTGATAYDPFGNKLPSTTGTPQNTEAGSFDWVGVARKQTENGLALNVTQMGARVYVPSLGRFLQVDSVEGGTLNSYVYAQDPVNQYDISGKFIQFIPIIAAVISFVAAVAPKIVNVAPRLISAATNAVKAVGNAIKSVGSAAKSSGGRASTAASKPSAAPAPKALPNMAASRQQTTVHGNSLSSQRPTWGYKLYSNDGTFLKNGITSKTVPEKRYTNSFMDGKYMEKSLFSNRRDAYDWEFAQNQILRGPLNLNMH